VCHSEWQNVDALRLSCHWWQEVNQGRLPAMTTLLIAALLISLMVTAVIAVANWLAEDGGPRRSPMPQAQDGWSVDLPSRPYALR
jgi:hypothetical protein